MEPLTYPAGRPAPGPHESWREYAEHSADHDQLSTALPDPGAYRRYAARRLAELRAQQQEARHG